MARSNLFAIDFDASLRAVSDANADLVAHHRRMMEARARVPARLVTEDEVDRARRFLALVAHAAKRCRQARLDDTKPLRDLLRRVESVFKSMEAEAAATQGEIVARLTEAGRREAARRACAARPTAILVDARSGEVIGTASARPPEAPEPTIRMVVEVGSVDRATLDLEALRPFLTDAALLVAARAHHKAHGSRPLRGVAYADRAQLH